MAATSIGCEGRPGRAGTRTCDWTLLKALAVLPLFALAPEAGAQSSRSSAMDDLRPAYATAADVADGKRVADGMCAKCHGASGISATRGVPHLAGQRPSYRYAKIKAYQSGARDDHAMESAVKFLNDEALVRVAAYCAAQQGRPAQTVQDPVVQLADKCDRCHVDAAGTAQLPAPRLRGQDRDYLVMALRAYRDDRRDSSAMHKMSTAFSEAVIDGLAAYYAGQPMR